MMDLVGEDDVNVFQIIFFQILLRLPVRSLLRFRCVCKEWCELIDSCVFKDTYLALRRAIPVDDQLVVLKTSDVPYEDMDRGIFSVSVTCWYGDYQSLALYVLAPSSSSWCNDFEISGIYSVLIRIINHVDGIVCFIDNGDNWLSTVEKKNKKNWLNITLVNPALREIRKLPIPMFDLLGGIFKRHVQGVGFGYDDSSNEYKVVAIVTVFEEEDDYVSPYKHIGIVYHLSTNCWKILDDMSEFVSQPFVCFPYKESVFSHGSLHWCMQSDDEPETKYRILAFDVTNESFREIPFPHGYRYYAPYEHDATFPHLFAVDKSTVALVASTNEFCDVQILEVWVMKEYGDGDSWTKQYSITNLPGFIEALCFWRKDKILLESQGSELICYDLFKGQLVDEPSSISGIPRQGLHLVTGHESFVSVMQV